MTNSITYQRVENQLQFDDSTFPLVVTPPSESISLEHSIAWIKENQAELEDKLSKAGTILFRGFPMHDAETFDEFSSAFNYPSFTYQESLSNAVRINFTERVFTANEAPKDVEIYLHHEMAQTPVYPSKLFFFCEIAPTEGGATPICRSDILLEELEKVDADLVKRFTEKGVSYTNIMPPYDDSGSGQGRSWRSTLGADTKKQAEGRLAELGYTWEWMEDESLRAKTPTLPAVRKVSDGRPVFFNQLIAAFRGWKDSRNDPSKSIAFGDDTPITDDDMAQAIAISDRITYDLAWQTGDVALIDNFLAMHGRRPYSGKRRVLASLIA